VKPTIFTKRITETRYNLGAVSRNTGYYKTTKIVCHVTSTVNRLVLLLTTVNRLVLLLTTTVNRLVLLLTTTVNRLVLLLYYYTIPCRTILHCQE